VTSLYWRKRRRLWKKQRSQTNSSSRF
jgi:hypothetical protein